MVIDTTGEDPYIPINPRIVESSGESRPDRKGVLGNVTRPNYVKAGSTGCEYEAPPRVEGTEGYLARAICHELDHLGTVISMVEKGGRTAAGYDLRG